jgi:hypothetical protein
MAKTVIGSILHGAYGDLYEQAICLKHYVDAHPDVELKLFAATQVRLEAFRVLDLSFASSFELWTEIERHPEIDRFFQFQVLDRELNLGVISRLSPPLLAKIDREKNNLPWIYLRDNKLIPTPPRLQLAPSPSGLAELDNVIAGNAIPPAIWSKPTVNFLWRYRGAGPGAIRNFGQKPEEKLREDCSLVFQRLVESHDIHLLVCGMNVVTDEKNRERTDNKYPSFGLNLPAANVTYMKGLSWPLELEIASRATVCCGHASGFTEGLWLKRGRDMVLMDPPPHYLAKVAYYRMPLFNLGNPFNLVDAFMRHSPDTYYRRIAAMIKESSDQVRRRPLRG